MELQIINEQEVLGKHFTVYGTADEPLFVAKDVAEWIEHSNPTEMLKSVDDDEKLTSTILRAGQIREVNLLTENGLYEVLMQSRKPLAKEFKKKVKEILKSIRKHGLYAIDDLLENPDMAIAALQKLKEERQLRLKAQEEVAQKESNYPRASAESDILRLGSSKQIVSSNFCNCKRLWNECKEIE